jgi:hypothetical protein
MTRIKIFGILLAFAGAAFAVEGQDATIWPEQKWHAALPEEVGMDSALLAAARDYAMTGGGSGMIVRRGRVVMQWGDQQQTYDLKSSTKAIGVTAVGVALKDGKFPSLHEPASNTTRPLARRPRAIQVTTDWKGSPCFILQPRRPASISPAGTRSCCSSPARSGPTATGARTGWPSVSRWPTGGTYRT